MIEILKVISNSPDETEKIGEKLASRLKIGDLIALYGDLGSGKTYFVKGLARGLEVKQTVKSPSYSIINEYSGKYPVFHIDFYRLENNADIESTGWLEYFDYNGIIIIEWANKVKKLLPKRRFDVYFDVLGDETRQLEIIAVDGTWD